MLSPKLDVYSVEWLNVVFANRNQSYGAYELRKNYNWRLTKALMLASSVFIGGFCGPMIYRNLKQEKVISGLTVTRPKLDDEKIVIVTLPSQKKIEKPKAAGDKGAAAPKAKTIDFRPLSVVPESQSVEPPSQTALQNAVVGKTNQDGWETMGNIPSGPVDGNDGESITGGTGAGTGDGGSDVYALATLEHQPEFPGGMEAFVKYLRKHLQYPGAAAENGIAGRVSVSFVVEKDGSLTDVTVVKGIGFGCDEEALRVLKKSPKWSAGEQNGRKVRVMYTVPIVFSMGE